KAPKPRTVADFAAATATKEPKLPSVDRAVPTHDIKLLSGCSEGDLELSVRVLEEAIEVGAPLYNQGNFAACYHIYEGAALDLERRLPAGRRGPTDALCARRGQA